MDDSASELILKLVNPSGSAEQRTIQLADARLAGNGAVTVLSAADAGAVNSIASPGAIAPVTQSLEVKGRKLSLTLPACSFTVVRLKIKINRAKM